MRRIQVLKYAVLFLVLAGLGVSTGLDFSSLEAEDGLYLGDGQESPENIVYISLDAVSASHLDCYGYSRDTAPNICGLDNATIYGNAHSASYYTPTSLSSMATGIYPHNMTEEDHPWTGRLDNESKTLAEILKEEGYRTVLRTNHPLLNKDRGFDQGFEEFQFRSNSSLIRWPGKLGDEIQNGRVYYRMHLDASHTQYDPTRSHYDLNEYRYVKDINSEILREEDASDLIKKNISRTTIVNHYDENIRGADKYVGKFIQQLKDRGQYKNSLIIITADHGEGFNNYGNDIWGHGVPNPAVTRIPLIVKYPESDGSSYKNDLVSNIDPFKIIMNEVGASVDHRIDAIDPRRDERERHFTSIESQQQLGCGVSNGTHHFYYTSFTGSRYFHLEEGSARESNRGYSDLRVSGEECIRKLREIREIRRKLPQPGDDKMKERLRKLGYID